VQITTTGHRTTTDFDGTSNFTEAAGDTLSISGLFFRIYDQPQPSCLVVFRSDYPQTLTDEFLLLANTSRRSV
jgi:hypothetical protein